MNSSNQTSDNLFDLSGKIACVTGASSGLGRHAASVLAQRGAKVVGLARRQDMLDQWLAETGGLTETGGQTAAIACDLSDRDKIPDIAGQVSSLFGTPDVLVHAAGINTRETADDVTPEGWDISLMTNLSVPFFLSQQFIPAMKDKGWGRIINFASLQTFRAFPGGIAYGAAKAGVGQMTRAMAECWSKDGININAIGPGFFKTELTAAVFDDPERAARNAEQTCIGRNGDLSDIDGPLVFLASDASAYMTGQILMVDGGFTAK